MRINDNFLKLPGSYLFAEIDRRVGAYTREHPERDLVRLGIGDVTLPLVPAITQAIHQAVDEMGQPETFRGYPPYRGYDFLLQAIVEHDYRARGVELSPEEVFVSDGAKSDCSGIGDILGTDNLVAVCDPVYPVYVDANAIAGRLGNYDRQAERWERLVYMPCTAENGFSPSVPDQKVDMIYLCFPNNPTGTTATRQQLQAWVDYANANGSLILFDSAYEAFITEPDIPHSIFEIPGARTCAIEFRSFSKTAGFTGTRCAYTVIPRELQREGVSLNELWYRRQSTKFNGVSYVVQRGAAATYTPEGRRQVMEHISYYLGNAKTIREGLSAAGLTVYGGVNAPYVWVRTPEGTGSWDFFDRLLREANVVTTPGAGFGPSGEGYIRLTGFGGAEATRQAVERVRSIL